MYSDRSAANFVVTHSQAGILRIWRRGVEDYQYTLFVYHSKVFHELNLIWYNTCTYFYGERCSKRFIST